MPRRNSKGKIASCALHPPEAFHIFANAACTLSLIVVLWCVIEVNWDFRWLFDVGMVNVFSGRIDFTFVGTALKMFESKISMIMNDMKAHHPV